MLLQDQQVILLDEPFNAIDTKTLIDLTLVIKEWQSKNRTIIMVTHDLEYVRDNCPSSMLLAKECIDYGSTNVVLTKENLDNAKKFLKHLMKMQLGASANMIDFFINPFIDYAFMRRAFIGGLVICVGAIPVGIFMTLRRMSLTGDAMAHAILPGAAIAYLISVYHF